VVSVRYFGFEPTAAVAAQPAAQAAAADSSSEPTAAIAAQPAAQPATANSSSNIHVRRQQRRDCVQCAARLLLRYQRSVLDEQNWVERCCVRDLYGLLHLLRSQVQRRRLAKAVRVPHLTLLVRSAEASHLCSQRTLQQPAQWHQPV
jgi:hypothetical protein